MLTNTAAPFWRCCTAFSLFPTSIKSRWHWTSSLSDFLEPLVTIRLSIFLPVEHFAGYRFKTLLFKHFSYLVFVIKHFSYIICHFDSVLDVFIVNVKRKLLFALFGYVKRNRDTAQSRPPKPLLSFLELPCSLPVLPGGFHVSTVWLLVHLFA